MDTQLSRLQTFDRFPLRYISASELASDGFYYTQKEAFVKCFRCNWIVDCLDLLESVVKTHRRQNPQCGKRRHYVSDGWND